MVFFLPPFAEVIFCHMTSLDLKTLPRRSVTRPAAAT